MKGLWRQLSVTALGTCFFWGDNVKDKDLFQDPPLTQVGLLTVALDLRPSWPQLLLPNMKSFPFSAEKHQRCFETLVMRKNNCAIDNEVCAAQYRAAPVIKAVCSSPQAIFNGTSFLSQNLLGTLSANLLFPKVKTAPDSAR